MNTPLINASAVREMALRLSQDTRAGKFTRVSESFLIAVNSAVEAEVRRRVHSHPSLGKTLMAE